MSREKRRRFVVDKKLQWALARRLILYWFLFVAGTCIYSLLLVYLADPLTSLQEMKSQLMRCAGPIALSSVVLIPVVIRDSIKFSQRFVGPILRFQRVIQRVGIDRDIAPLKIRPRDFWKECSQDINAMLVRVAELRPADTKTETPSGELVEAS